MKAGPNTKKTAKRAKDAKPKPTRADVAVVFAYKASTALQVVIRKLNAGDFEGAWRERYDAIQHFDLMAEWIAEAWAHKKLAAAAAPSAVTPAPEDRP